MKAKFRVLALTISILTVISVLHAQWVIQNSGTTATLTDVSMLDSTTAIAVGEKNVILKTTNSGTTWTLIPLPIDVSTRWNALSFFDASNGIVAGDLIIATTTNGGKQWNFHPLPGERKCLSALQIGPANVYMGDDSGWVHHSLDTGKTWTSERISTSPIRSLFTWHSDLIILRPDYIIGLSIYALTPYSLYSKMEFSSSSWKETILPFHGLGSEAFDGEFCNGSGAGFIVGVAGDLYAAPTVIRKSISDTAWRAIPTGIPQGGPLLGVSAPSANVIYVCGSGGMISKSTDGGDTWGTYVLPFDRMIMPNLNAIYLHDEKRGFSVGDMGLILYTSNGAVTSLDHQTLFPLVLGSEWLYTFDSTTHSEKITDTARINGLLYYGLSYENNQPSNWFRTSNDSVFIMYSVKDTAENLLYVFNANVGDCWNISNSNCWYGIKITLVSKTDTIISAAADTFKNCYHFSHTQNCMDAGIVDSWFAEGIGRVRYSTENLWGMATYVLSSYKVITSVKQCSSRLKVSNFVLYDNYPNPFNPTTTIEFTIPRSMYVSLKVFNLIGEEVATLISNELSAGTHKVRWDTRQQSSGVYFYRLETAGCTETKKLVILK